MTLACRWSSSELSNKYKGLSSLLYTIYSIYSFSVTLSFLPESLSPILNKESGNFFKRLLTYHSYYAGHFYTTPSMITGLLPFSYLSINSSILKSSTCIRSIVSLKLGSSPLMILSQNSSYFLKYPSFDHSSKYKLVLCFNFT